jgi:hypothetical protein
MIIWGQRANQNAESWQSLGAVATGVTHDFTRYRSLADGAALHPLQRTGQVAASSHDLMPRMTTFGGYSLGDGPRAAAHAMALPPVNTIGGPGTSLDPAMRV